MHIRLRLNRKALKRVNSSSAKYRLWWNSTNSKDFGCFLKLSGMPASLGGIISPLLFKGGMLSCLRAYGRYCSRLWVRSSPMLCDKLKESASVQKEMGPSLPSKSLICYNRKIISLQLPTWNGNDPWAFESSIAPLSCNWFLDLPGTDMGLIMILP
jgi:hypothetical protein